jgi:hypothetical protein
MYTTGTVTVTNNSNTVIGTGTAWLTNVAAGYSFSVRGDPAVYTIGAVVDDDEITLTANYGGASVSDVLYQIATDFTPNLGLTEISFSDKDWPAHLTQGVIRKLDSLVATSILTTSASYTFSASDYINTIIGYGNINITLPPASSPRTIRLKEADTGTMTINREGSTDTIEGATSLQLSGKASVTLQSDGGKIWWIY